MDLTLVYGRTVLKRTGMYITIYLQMIVTNRRSCLYWCEKNFCCCAIGIHSQKHHFGLSSSPSALANSLLHEIDSSIMSWLYGFPFLSWFFFFLDLKSVRVMRWKINKIIFALFYLQGHISNSRSKKSADLPLVLVAPVDEQEHKLSRH